MKYIHQKLASGKWQKLSLMLQLANIGSEVHRMITWQKKKKEYADLAFERALKLLDLTIEDPKNIKRLKELTRIREILADYYFGENEYNFSSQSWQNYFLPYNYVVNLHK